MYGQILYSYFRQIRRVMLDPTKPNSSDLLETYFGLGERHYLYGHDITVLFGQTGSQGVWVAEWIVDLLRLGWPQE